MTQLHDIFGAPEVEPVDEPTQLVEQTAGRGSLIFDDPDEAEIDARFALLQERNDQAHRAATNRQNAATARAVAQSFSEYGRAFRKVATSKGSPVDYAVVIDLAVYCETKADEYVELQARCAAAADRAGS